MSKSSDYGGIDVLTLEPPSLYHWLDSQDDGWKELPDDREFARLDVRAPNKLVAKLKRKLSNVLRKPKIHARAYAFQPL